MRGMRAANSLLRGNAAAGAPLSARTWFTTTPLRPTTTLQTSPTTPAARPAPWHTPATAALSAARPFSHTASCQKKKSRKQKQPQDEEEDEDADADAEPPTSRRGFPKAAAPSPPKPSPAAPADPNRLTADPNHPFDLADLHNNLARAEAHFTEELKKLRSSGRFNADGLGSLLVQPDRKSGGQSFPLRELATVAPLGGRRWSILAFEESSVRAIASAVQRSEAFNQQPQRSADNPLELVMSVEPERGEALARRAREACQEWRTRVREEAHKREKAHKKWRGEGLLTADDVVRLKGMVQKVQDERMKGILGKEKEVVGAIMARGS